MPCKLSRGLLNFVKPLKKLSEKFSDEELDVVFAKKPEEIIKDTKFASEFCEKKI